MNEQITTDKDVSHFYNEVLMYSAIPAYTLLLIFGVVVGQNAVGSLFVVMILLSHYAAQKTSLKLKVSILRVSKSGLYKATFYTIGFLCVMHCLTNILFYDLVNPVSSLFAFFLCYAMLGFTVKTLQLMVFVREKRENKNKKSNK
ncbi:hypothetical protein [Alteromonas sp. BZK5]|uniref:hypothetical protein n=1 Tax=Alteromonas sp. BZK5 TaxID=1904459 RepID=UPI0016535318|nr:hypothetical protein [Alteromonas sp. BZK5]MBC6987973.1 hypothetical protein [Alteromonas sp. BZK5]